MPWFQCAGCTVMFTDAHRLSVMMRHTFTAQPVGEYPRVEEVQGIERSRTPESHREGFFTERK